MARESRHVKITNLPADANVVQIREFFSKDFGRIQKVEPLADECDEDQQCIVVSFMDIKTASRAIEAITGGGGGALGASGGGADFEWADGRQLKAFYYEPKGSAAPQIHENSDPKHRRRKIAKNCPRQMKLFCYPLYYPLYYRGSMIKLLLSIILSWFHHPIRYYGFYLRREAI